MKVNVQHPNGTRKTVRGSKRQVERTLARLKEQGFVEESKAFSRRLPVRKSKPGPWPRPEPRDDGEPKAVIERVPTVREATARPETGGDGEPKAEE